jgi:hypothetical protein
MLICHGRRQVCRLSASALRHGASVRGNLKGSESLRDILGGMKNVLKVRHDSESECLELVST